MVVAVISPHSGAQDLIAKTLERTGRVDTVWSLPAYPEPSQLRNLPEDPHGSIVFLDFSSPQAALAITVEAAKLPRSIAIVAMKPQGDAGIGSLERIGVRHVIGLPPTALEVLSVFAKLNPERDHLAAGPDGGGRIFAFLPAKPGAGATTLAVHTAAALARLSGERTLLMDFDFRLGMTSFLLKLPGEHSIVDALNDIDRVHLCWNSLVNPRGFLDILGSAPRELTVPNLEQRTASLLNFARSRYQTVVVDLPGEMQEYEIDALRRSTNCFLVCNSDIGVMHMAKRKSELLHTLVLEEKTSVLVNRAGGLGMISPRDVEAILHLPVRFSVANAYREIAEATRAASTLEGRGGVITQIENIARWMMPSAVTEPAPAEQTTARKFLQFFGTGGGRGGGR
jgi:pilus assembly protein CpaE